MIHKWYCKVLQEYHSITIKSVVFFVDFMVFFERGYVCSFDTVVVKMHTKCFELSYAVHFYSWPLRPVLNEVTQISLIVRLYLKH